MKSRCFLLVFFFAIGFGQGIWFRRLGVTKVEWEAYDGWFNNPAHPEWGSVGEDWFGL